MNIEILNKNEFGVLGHLPTPFQNNIENGSRMEEFFAYVEEQQLQLEKCSQEALDSSQDDGLYRSICLLLEKALFLEDLGKLEEAYLCHTEALSKVPFLYEEVGKGMLDKLLHDCIQQALEDESNSLEDLMKLHHYVEEAYIPYNNTPYNESVPVEEKEELFPKLEDLLSNPFIKKILGMKIQEVQNDILISRGFLSLKLKEKNSAIDDFRRASSSEYEIVDAEYDLEFLFRILEKSLGVQIAPVKDYEKEIENLLNLEKVDEVCEQLMMFYALTGQHEEALKWFRKIKDEGYSYRTDIPFFLAYLKGDMETAKKVLDYNPLFSRYKLIMNPEL